MSLPDKPAGGHSSRPSRGVGDAPGIGRVSRMRRDTRPPEERPKPGKPLGKPSLQDFKPTLAMGLTVMLVLGGLLVAGLVVWAMNAKKAPAPPEAGTRPVAVHGKDGQKVPAPPSNELEDQVNAFLKVRNPDELTGMIRKTAAQEPAAMVEKLAKLEEEDGKLRGVKYLFPLHSRCLQLEAVLVDFVGGRNRLALLAPDADGKWRIDFDGFDRYGSPSWASLLTGGATEGKVRVNLVIDAYYNGYFRDESKWVCYSMQSADHTEAMFCYAPRNSVLHRALDSVLAQKGFADDEISGRSRLRRVIVGIKHHEGTHKRQFEVTRVFSDEWAEGDKAFDEIVAEKEAAEKEAAEAKPEPEPAPDK